MKNRKKRWTGLFLAVACLVTMLFAAPVSAASGGGHGNALCGNPRGRGRPGIFGRSPEHAGVAPMLFSEILQNFFAAHLSFSHPLMYN